MRGIEAILRIEPAVLFLLCLMHTACWTTAAYIPRREPEDLPVHYSELVSMADEKALEGAPRKQLMRALDALEKALDLRREPGRERMEILWRKSRVLYLLADSATVEDPMSSWLEAGEEAGREAAGIMPERVEGHYYQAINKGLLAQDATVGAITMVPDVAEAARRAIEIDESYDDAGPLRLLGKIYVMAPPWPASIGDLEEGISLLEKACTVSSYPLNRLFLGEAYIEAGEKEQGLEHIYYVLRQPRKGRWAVTGERWRTYARMLLRKLEND